MKSSGHRHAFLVALAGSAVFWLLAQNPVTTSAEERKSLASRFRFGPAQELSGLPGAETHTIRTINPSLVRQQQHMSALSAGVTLADLDGDGLPNDIIYTDNRTEQLIAAPAPGSTPRYAPFQLVVKGFDRPHAGPCAALVGDVNEDGLADVIAQFVGRGPIMLVRKNDGSPLGPNAFEPVEITKEIKGTTWCTAAALFSDLDGDGHTDLVLGNYFPDWCDVYNPEDTRIQEMHNSNGWACNGGGLHFYLWKKPTPEDPSWFTEVKGLLPERVLHGWTLALGAYDLDGDGLPDLYSGNDLGPDRLLLNRSTPGKLKFEVTEGAGKGFATPGAFVIGRDTYKGMACDFADLNEDGLPEIFVSNVSSEYGLQESHFLWMSQVEKGAKPFADGTAPYFQASERLGVSRGGWGWDAKFESFANQVKPDLVQARGFIKGKITRWPEMQALAAYNTTFLSDPRNWPSLKPGMDVAGNDRNAFFTFGSGDRYHDVGDELCFKEPMVSRSVATADVDGDGRVDLAVGNMWGPSFYWRNESPEVGRFVGLRLVIPQAPGELRVLEGRPAVTGRPAFGAALSVKLPDGKVLAREVDGGNGHCGRRSPEVHFGLGKIDAKTVEVSLRWRAPDGSLESSVQTVAVDKWHTVVLGSTNGKAPKR